MAKILYFRSFFNPQEAQALPAVAVYYEWVIAAPCLLPLLQQKGAI